MSSSDIMAIVMILICLIIFILCAIFLPEWVGINKQKKKQKDD